ncbi:hypothetical protein ACNAN0_01265 [Agrilactobacillus fermenti]|uniref:hypothetical protein n=1 Tax=Agrilactobacillus fermenti TaxID=2586909 RepID=UPI003A5C3AD0
MKKKLGLYLGVVTAALLAAAPLAVVPKVFETAETSHVQAAATLPDRNIIANWQVGSTIGVFNTSTQAVDESPAAVAGTNVPITDIAEIQGKHYAITASVGGGPQYYLHLDATTNLPVDANTRIVWLLTLEKLPGQVVQPAGYGHVNGTYYKLHSTTGGLEATDAATAAQINAAIEKNDGTVQPVAAYAYFAAGTFTQENYYGFVLGDAVYYLKEDSLATANIKIAPYTNTNVPNVPSEPTLPILHISDVAGTVITTEDEVAAFNNANLTSYAGIFLPQNTKLIVDQVAKRDDGTIVAYHVAVSADQAAGKWLSADKVIFTAKADEVQTPQLTLKKLPVGTVVYSQSAARIYHDAATTNDSGKRLALTIDEWRAFEKAVDENGRTVAYRLGTDQWVKASVLNFEKVKGGVFTTRQGTPLYTAEGQFAGKIAADGVYQVFAQRHINGKQALKLGTDAQWIYAENGGYYP